MSKISGHQKKSKKKEFVFTFSPFILMYVCVRVYVLEGISNSLVQFVVRRVRCVTLLKGILTENLLKIEIT